VYYIRYITVIRYPTYDGLKMLRDFCDRCKIPYEEATGDGDGRDGHVCTAAAESIMNRSTIHKETCIAIVKGVSDQEAAKAMLESKVREAKKDYGESVKK